MTVFEGSRLFIADNTGDELWEIDPDGSDTEGVELRNLPSGLTNPWAMTVFTEPELLPLSVSATAGDPTGAVDLRGSIALSVSATAGDPTGAVDLLISATLTTSQEVDLLASWYEIDGLIKKWIPPVADRPQIVTGLVPTGTDRYLGEVQVSLFGDLSLYLTADLSEAPGALGSDDLTTLFENKGGFRVSGAGKQAEALIAGTDTAEPYSVNVGAPVQTLWSALSSNDGRQSGILVISDGVIPPNSFDAYVEISATAGDPTASIGLAPYLLTVSANADEPMARASLQAPSLRASVNAGEPTANIGLRAPTLAVTVAAGIPTISARMNAAISIANYVSPMGYRPVVLALLQADIAGSDITANPATTIGMGNDLVVANDLTVVQVERHVAGSEIRLRRSGDALFSKYFDNEGTPRYPDARLQIVLENGFVIDGAISNTGGGFNNWSVSDAGQQARLNEIVTGDLFLLAILVLTPVIAATAVAAGAATAFVNLRAPTLAALSSTGEPFVSTRLRVPTLAVSANAAEPTAAVRLGYPPLAVSASAAEPTAAVRLGYPPLAVSASAGMPTAKASLTGQPLSVTAAAGAPTVSADLESAFGVLFYKIPNGYTAIVLAHLDADISGVDITADPTVTISTGNDLVVANDLTITQVERHVGGAQIRLRKDGSADFSVYFDNEGTPRYPDARLQLVLENGFVIDGVIGNTGGGFNNWSVSDAGQQARLNEIVTGDEFLLVILALTPVIAETAVAAGEPFVSARLRVPTLAVSASAGEPTVSAILYRSELAVSASAAEPTVTVRLGHPTLAVLASAGMPTGAAALHSEEALSAIAAAGNPTASAYLIGQVLSVSVSAGDPVVFVDVNPQVIQWPATLPTNFLERGFGTAPRDNVNRFSVDSGPDMRRRRFTKSQRVLQGTMRMTPDEWKDFKKFYLDTLAGGSGRFLFPRPMGIGTVSVRFSKKPVRTRGRIDWLVALALRTE